MSEVRFYHLTRTPLETALPQMLDKTLARGQRAVVMAGSPERVEALDGLLWTQADQSFLPHGTAKDGHAADQPIWLTSDDEAPNGAEVLFLTDGADSAQISRFVLCAVLFDGRDEGAVLAARAHWSRLKADGHELSYWQQDERGSWQKR